MAELPPVAEAEEEAETTAAEVEDADGGEGLEDGLAAAAVLDAKAPAAVEDASIVGAAELLACTAAEDDVATADETGLRPAAAVDEAAGEAGVEVGTATGEVADGVGATAAVDGVGAVVDGEGVAAVVEGAAVDTVVGADVEDGPAGGETADVVEGDTGLVTAGLVVESGAEAADAGALVGTMGAAVDEGGTVGAAVEGAITGAEVAAGTAAEVGAGAGVDVGETTAAEVGVGTGDVAGWTGADVGDGTGAEVGAGAGAGAEVGAGTGAEVGAGAGADVGRATGADVGEGTGTEVGGGLGAEVGVGADAEVGEGTGAEVGADKLRMRSDRHCLVVTTVATDSAALPLLWLLWLLYRVLFLLAVVMRPSPPPAVDRSVGEASLSVSAVSLPCPPPPPCAPPRPLRVLTLGDGNFTFSLALLRLYCPSKREPHRRLPPASPLLPNHSEHSDPHTALRVIASVFDSEAELAAKYPETAQGIVEQLRRRGAEVLFNVDATDIQASVATERQRQRSQQWAQRTEAADGSDSCTAVADSGLAVSVPESLPLECVDVVVFHHPHSGREDVHYHRRLLSHFLHSVHAVSHRSTTLILSLCDRQPWQWQLRERAQRHGWSIWDMGGWEAEMEEWAARGYESKRHHTGRQFNAHHVTVRHKVTLRRQTDSHSDTEQQTVQSWRERFPLLFKPAQPHSDELLKQLTRCDDQAADESEELTEASGELRAAVCSICRQAHSQLANRVQPLSATEGRVACELCHVTFTNQRALQQHSAAMEGRHDHIALSEGEGKRTRHRKLREEGIITHQMTERGERIKAKKQQRRARTQSGQ